MLRITTLLVVLAAASPAFAEPTQIDRDDLRRALKEQRKVNLARFHDYRRHKVYPHNTYEPGMMNIWRDSDERLCAVATLVHLDGKDALVDKIALDQNFVRTADLTSGPLVDWMLTSGFTQEEIVMIQAPTDEDIAREDRARRRAEARELVRLAKVYKSVETTLATPRVAEAGLDLATARLAERPELAQALLAKFPAP